MEPTVVIIGAGIAGLTLAQGLSRHGISFLLIERDSTVRARSQGYRVRISDDGITALTENVSAGLFDKLRQVCPATTTNNHIPLHNFEATTAAASVPPFPPQTSLSTVGGDPILADRTVLREVLCEGIRASIVFGAEYDHFDEGADFVTVHFKNHPIIQCRYLIGADGVRSAV